MQGFPTAARTQGIPTRKVISATEIEGASETLYSDSSVSNASYPLTLSAQRQRKLSSCNLKKSRFGNPYFGFLAGSPDNKHVRSLDPSRHLGAASPVNSQNPKSTLESSNPLKINLASASKTKDLGGEADKNKPVFVISEEGDDQQPLVLAEHLSQCGDHLSEPNAVYAVAVPDKQPVVLTVEGNTSASLTSNLPFWAKSPGLYKGQVRVPNSPRDQQSSSVVDANTSETSQNFDTLAAPTLCQASVQWYSQKDWNTKREATGTWTEWKQCQTVVWQLYMDTTLFREWPLPHHWDYSYTYYRTAQIPSSLLLINLKPILLHGILICFINESIWKVISRCRKSFLERYESHLRSLNRGLYLRCKLVLCHCGTPWVFLLEAMS